MKVQHATNRNIAFVILVQVLIVSSCSQGIATAPSELYTKTLYIPSETISQAPLPATITPYSQPLQSDLSRYTIHCIEMVDALPDGISLSGILAYDIESEGAGSYLWDLESDHKLRFGNTLAMDMAVSLDRFKLAYKDFEREAVVVIYANGNQVSILHDPDWRYDPAQWLDEEHLALNYRHKEIGAPFVSDSIVVLNPLTGDRQEFFPEYPHFDNLTNSVNWQSYSSSRLVFNSSLSYLVYPGIEGMENPLILWNQRSQHEVARIHEHLSNSGHALSAPRWSPSGTNFVTSALLRYAFDLTLRPVPVRPLHTTDVIDENTFINVDDDYPYVGGYELVSVSTMGEINRLSYLTTKYDALESGWTWSPDGKLIAFWLQFYENGYSEPQLAVLDVKTGTVTDYCLSGVGVPIWSPNGRQLIINTFDDETYSSGFYLVDLDLAIAVIMSEDEDASAGGWLTGLP